MDLTTSSATRRPAFTLTEMLVSIGLLLLVMGMASTVFKVTLEGTGRLTQLSEIDRSIRLFKDNLARELRGVDPTRSALAIQGNPSPAYWSQAQFAADENNQNLFDYGGADPDGIAGELPIDTVRQNPTRGYDVTGAGSYDPDSSDDGAIRLPRADILMFVTDMPEARSFVYPDIHSDGPVMIVYNHAQLGTLSDVNGADGRVTINAACNATFSSPICPADSTDDWSLDLRDIPQLTNGPAMDPRGCDNVQCVAQDWHLARRAVLLKGAYDPLEESGFDRFSHFLSPTNNSGNVYAGFGVDPDGTGTTVEPNRERHYLNWILGGEMDVVSPAAGPVSSGMISNGTTPLQDFRYEYEVPNRLLGCGMPVGTPCPDDPNLDGDGIPEAPQIVKANGEYRGSVPSFWLARSHLDENPPANMAHRMGHFFLPNCASFKVEWTPNDVLQARAGLPEVLWIDPFKEPGEPWHNGPLDSITPVAAKPRHLDEFEIMAQKVSPEAGTYLVDNAVLGAVGSLGDSRLNRWHQALLPRFGMSVEDPANPGQSIVGPFQMNSYDNDPSTPHVEPSYNTHVWHARDVKFAPNGPVTTQSADQMWPQALRITLDLFDDAGAFETPIRHTFILPIGSQADLKQSL
jgi:type II secretory pathway pseudopilin PulG